VALFYLRYDVDQCGGGLNSEAPTAREIASKSTERRAAFPVDRSCELWSKCRCPSHRPTLRHAGWRHFADHL